MPNYCSYEMKVNGKKESQEKLLEIMKADYDYNTMEFSADKHLFRIFEASLCEFSEDDDFFISGYCAWSVYSCMMEGEHSYYNSLKERFPNEFRGTTLVELSKELDLEIEVFSEEPGCGFMEHYIIKNGELIVNKCHEYEEVYDEKTEEYTSIGGIDWDYTI